VGYAVEQTWVFELIIETSRSVSASQVMVRAGRKKNGQGFGFGS
jgi:hypothetical protein